MQFIDILKKLYGVDIDLKLTNGDTIGGVLEVVTDDRKVELASGLYTSIGFIKGVIIVNEDALEGSPFSMAVADFADEIKTGH